MQQDDKRALWYLKKIPLLADVGAETIQRLVKTLELREIRRRQVVYLPGDPGDSVYFVNGGRLKVSKVTRDGKELTLAYRVPGEIFGELCLIEGGPREEMSEAMENSLISVVDRVLFEQILTKEGLISSRLVKVVAQRRREVENKIEQLIFKDVNAKLAELLLRLGDEYGIEDARGILVSLKITHQEMANLIGSTRETVSLTLSQFKRRGFIHTEGRKVILADRDGLRALA
jgi:CRP/FNR family transcriptional regulator, cyclic AMP receptor protein